MSRYTPVAAAFNAAEDEACIVEGPAVDSATAAWLMAPGLVAKAFAEYRQEIDADPRSVSVDIVDAEDQDGDHWGDKFIGGPTDA